MQTFTLKQIADRNGVSKSTVKAYASRNGYKPVDTTGNAYKYPADLMAVITEKYGEPANSKKLFSEAVANAESKHADAPAKQVDALTKRVDQLIDFAGWWAELDDQRIVPVDVYRYILGSKIVRTDKESIKLLSYFGGFSLNPMNNRLKRAVTNGTFNYFAHRLHHITKDPANEYVLLARWHKYSDKNKHLVVKLLDESLSKKFKSYREFKSGGSGGRPLDDKKAESATGSEEPVAERCNSALLASQNDKEMEV